jgi:hypothetical protein
MKAQSVLALAALTLSGSAALADPTIQLDVNALSTQTRNAAGAPSAFNGLTHTGSVSFSFDASRSVLFAVAIRQTPDDPFIDQGFTGALSNFTGTLNLVGGVVTGGTFTASVNGNSDSYTAQILPDDGSLTSIVQPYAGGGFTISGQTANGLFSDAFFGNVNVTPWFAFGGAPGSFLQFNFNPNAQGQSNADMDIFATVPAPGTLGLLAGAGLLAARRRR